MYQFNLTADLDYLLKNYHTGFINMCDLTNDYLHSTAKHYSKHVIFNQGVDKDRLSLYIILSNKPD